jgi:hypothetical protein
MGFARGRWGLPAVEGFAGARTGSTQTDLAPSIITLYLETEGFLSGMAYERVSLEALEAKESRR